MHEQLGRTLVNESFINKVENMANRVLHKQKPRPKKGTWEK
jgi:hypothetical protein